MAKRFTATDKWDDPWFCELSDPEKLFWFYLLDKCDHAGMWQVNWPLVKFHIKGVIDLDRFGERIAKISAEKWHIPKFIDFQYGGKGGLNPENKVHKSVLDILENQAPTKGLYSPLLGAKDKAKDKAKTKEQTHKDKSKAFTIPAIKDVQAYCAKRENGINPEKWLAHYEANGWRVGRNPMKDWKAAVRTWEHSQYNDSPVKKSPVQYKTIIPPEDRVLDIGEYRK